MSDPAPVLEALSVMAFAKRLRVDEKAVRKGIRNGRLSSASVGRDAKGRAVILDAALAEQEWERNRDPSRQRDGAFGTIAEERKLLIRAQRRKVDQAVRERARQLLPARALELRFATRVVMARTKLLGLPSRAKQRLPHLTAADLAELDVLIREALDELGADDAEPAR